MAADSEHVTLNVTFPLDSNDWEQDGARVVSRVAKSGQNKNNTNDDNDTKLNPIKELLITTLNSSNVEKDNVTDFFNGLLYNLGALNNTLSYLGAPNTTPLQRIIVHECPLYNGDLFQTILPQFLSSSNNVKYLEFDNCDMSPHTVTTMVSNAGAEHHLYNFLRVYISCFNEIASLRVFKTQRVDQVVCRTPQQILRSLASRKEMKKVVVWRYNKGDGTGNATLALLLNDANNLIVLDLESNCMDHMGTSILNAKSRWRAINEGSPSLQEALICDEVSWKIVSAILRGPMFKLEQLLLYGSTSSDTPTRTLFISGLTAFRLRSASGMDAVIDVIQKPNCILEDLNVTGYNFNDDNVIPFLDALMNNTSLKTLNMSGSLRQVSSTVWTRFAAVLENPTSKLESLNLCYSPINSMALSSFAHALAHNNTLVELLIYNSHDWNSNWREFPEVLCNKSSIMATFNSNHTLQKVTNSVTQPSCLSAYLQMNQEQNKFHVARQKIIQTHFTGDMDIDMQHFVDLELGVLPHAISWAGGAGLSFFYSFVRNNPLFYETGGRDYTGSGGTGVNKSGEGVGNDDMEVDASEASEESDASYSTSISY